jgi:hypothetical protein
MFLTSILYFQSASGPGRRNPISQPDGKLLKVFAIMKIQRKMNKPKSLTIKSYAFTLFLLLASCYCFAQKQDIVETEGIKTTCKEIILERFFSPTKRFLLKI